MPRRLATILLFCLFAALAVLCPPVHASTAPTLQEFARTYWSGYLFLDPDPNVGTKEFTLFHNSVPDPSVTPDSLNPFPLRTLFHLIYQRSGGPHAGETTFGHAWSQDLQRWTVDTLAFAVDTTWWCSQHVWSPSCIHRGDRDYLFFTGVDAANDQRIGYASTALLDTTDTVWDPVRKLVLQAEDTHWAVPDPWMYGGATQFRDPYVLPDPDDPRRLLLLYTALDSIDFKLGRGTLAAGVARSAPGSVDVWEDRGFYPTTLRSVTGVQQLEGPHAFSANGSGDNWRLMYTNAGSPPGENGNTTIRFQALKPGASLSDTTSANWGPQVILKPYLGFDNTVYGWSGSEELRASGADYLAGFTAWGPFDQGIAILRLAWNGTGFAVGTMSVTSVDEYRSPMRGLEMRLAGYDPRGSQVTFRINSPLATTARLDLFDAAGRRLRCLLTGTLPKGESSILWDLASDRGAAPSGVYFARLQYPGGCRAVRIPIVR